MRTAEIFNGKEFIKVTENETFRLEGVWNWDIGTVVTFQVKQGIKVEAIVQVKDGSGTKFIVTRIITSDELSEIEVEAEDVDVETFSNEEIINEEIEEIINEENIKFTKNRFTKRELIGFIAEYDIDIDTKNMSKADIVNTLTEMGYM